MTWCNSSDDDTAHIVVDRISTNLNASLCKACPSCGHRFQPDHIQTMTTCAIEDLPGLPAGVKFDPTDQELLEHLEGKARPESHKFHPLIDEFIPTIEGENGICYTHPEKLPGASKDGLVRHFFHRPSKAYTTGTRKRRKVHTDDEHGGETRWHKTGKTRAVLVGGIPKGYKKILVLYTNYGKQRKPEKTNWVMHQYHLGSDEEEKEGQLVVSKVFYQTQPRQCGMAAAKQTNLKPLIPAGLAIMFGYHLFLLYRILRFSETTWVGFENHNKRAWVQRILQPLRTCMQTSPQETGIALQVISSSIQASTNLAALSIALSSLIGTWIGSSSKVPITEVMIYGDTSQTTSCVKYVSLLVCFLAAFTCFIHAARDFVQASFMISTLDSDIPVGHVEDAVVRGSNFWSMGLRAMYFATTLLLWIFGPIPMFACSVFTVLVLYFLDSNSTPLHQFGSYCASSRGQACSWRRR
ncbi:hypothetical protein Cni_G00204 [Canna indica]|uniref:NAC domain-containing protein n=1 Tax=Canna indica TaxID=4628 RepID=A0AAQ3JLZ3_9LILI|nr:hypothetical protein Cni_G00204 [Canna indica]